MNIMAFFAHPDDETMLAGGTLALLTRSGAQVHYLCATRGEGGEMGEPALIERADLGTVREGELLCAVQALDGQSLTFLGYVDPTVGADNKLYAYSQDLAKLALQLAANLRQFKIEALITHGSNGEYGHPAHLVSHQAARLAVESLGEQAPLFYTVAAIYPEHPRPRLANRDDPADLVLDVGPVLAEKTATALCHRTQHALFVRRASEELGRQVSIPEVIAKTESLHRVKGSAQDAVTQKLRPWNQKRDAAG